ncbi:MAG: hypothetical protein ABSG36_08195 [Acidimicrobiales bacterium]
MSAPEPSSQEREAAFVDVLTRGTGISRLGIVRAFEAERGLGVVVVNGGGGFSFHSSAIADRSRQIALGSPVSFTVVAVPGGRFEAAGLTPATVQNTPALTPG